MANTGYGQERYGRSLYGALTYHNLEAVVQASASTSIAPSLNFNIPNQPINALCSISSNINHIFANQDVGINPTSSVSSIGQKVNLGTANQIIQNSGHLVHATQVDQPETFILVQPTIASVGTQIDLVVGLNINVNSSANVIGTQIDLGASQIAQNSGHNAIGTQIDLAQVNPIAQTVTTAVGTQIDLGASSSCNAKAIISTLNPIFSNVINNVVLNNFGSITIENSNTNPLLIPTSYNITFDLSSNTLSGKVLGISKVFSGINNTATTHISAKTDVNGNEYLQVSGASATSTAGGTASDKLRTIYKFNLDSSSTPSYTGSNWAYIYPKNAVTFDDGINATIGYQLVGGYNILTLDGRPVYQYSGDSSHDTANGTTVTNWDAIKKDGSVEVDNKSTTADDTLISSGASVTKSGTEGSSGAKFTFNKSTGQNLFIYEYIEGTFNSFSIQVSVDAGSVETVILYTGDMSTTIESGLISGAIRRYFLEANIPSVSSISIDGRLKWIKQTASGTTWTEQRLQRHNTN